jgi:cyclase
MLTKRVIVCLDVRMGRVVKGVGFRNHEDMGDVCELAERYIAQGVDELVFYDITASADRTRVDKSWVNRVARLVNVPFCVAGGIDSVKVAADILNAGADKISVNSPALMRPELINELAREFGSQSIVVGIDSKEEDNSWCVWQYTGREHTAKASGHLTSDWMEEAIDRGAGEIVLNCMDRDGHKNGFDIRQLAYMRTLCPVPLIASGGASSAEDFAEVFALAKVDGALGAGAFHRNELTVAEVKRRLVLGNFPVRFEEGHEGRV